MDIDIQLTQTTRPDVVSTELLRERVRQFSQKNREMQRAKSQDFLRFGLGDIREELQQLDLTEKDVNGLVTRIKRRKHATVEDMYRLSHAFLQDIRNIRVFAKSPGALQVIVKELTGIDSERQIGAVECICNLSLGEAPVCEKIANMAGSYLVTYLDSLDERLKRTSLWTLANILATDGRSAHTVAQMQLLPKLWRLYVDDSGDTDPASDFRDDAAICLQLMLSRQSRLNADDLQYIKQHMCEKRCSSVGAEYHLMLLFNCELVNPLMDLSDGQLYYLIEFILGNLCSTEDFSSVNNRLRILYGIRMLANMLSCLPNMLNLVVQQLSDVWQTNLEKLLNRIFAFKHNELTREALFLLRHLLAHQKPGQPLECRLENLKIPKPIAISN